MQLAPAVTAMMEAQGPAMTDMLELLISQNGKSVWGYDLLAGSQRRSEAGENGIKVFSAVFHVSEVVEKRLRTLKRPGSHSACILARSRVKP
jgi:hypothetical protein